MSRYSFSLLASDTSRSASRAQELRDYLEAQGEGISWEGESTDDYAQFDCVFLFAYEDDATVVENFTKHLEGQLQRPRVIVFFDEVFNCSLRDAWRSVIEPEMEIGAEHSIEASLSFFFEEVPDAGTHSNVGTPIVFDVSGETDVALDDSLDDSEFAPTSGPKTDPAPASDDKTEADFLLGDLELSGDDIELDSEAPAESLSAELEASLQALENMPAESTFQKEPEPFSDLDGDADNDSDAGLGFDSDSSMLEVSVVEPIGELSTDGGKDSEAMGGDKKEDSELSLGVNEEVSLNFGEEEASVLDSDSSSWGLPVAEASAVKDDFENDMESSEAREPSFDAGEESQIESGSDDNSSVFLGALKDGPVSEEASQVQEMPLGGTAAGESEGFPRILSGSEEIATVQKYAALKERESREKEATIQVLKGQMVKLEAKLQKSEKARRAATIECDELKNQVGTLEEELSQKNYYIQKSDGAHQEELKAINMRLDNAVFQANKAQNKYEDFRDRVRADFVKIRAQERELYNKLELQKRDAEALLASKDEHLLTLRRQVDQLEYELEGLRERWIDETEKSEDRAARLNRSLQSLKMAHDMLSGLNEEVLPSAGDRDLTGGPSKKSDGDEGEAA